MEKITPRIQAFASTVSSIFKRRSDISANDMSADARPPPYVLSRRCRFERLLSLVTLTLLLMLSIPALALKAYSYSFIESNMEMGFYLVNEQTGETEQDALVAALPLHLFRAPEKFVLVVAMISILLSMLHLIFVACDWKACMRTQTRAFRRNATVLHTINAILVVAALVALFVSHGQSSKFQPDLIPNAPNAVSPSGYRYFSYVSGYFDLETWTCELTVPKAVGDARHDYQAQCDIEVAGRTIFVPLFLVALAVAGVSVWSLITGQKQGYQNEHIYTKDIDLETGNESEGGKQVQVEEVELADMQRSERQRDGRLSKIEEGGEEAEEAGKQQPTTAEVVETGISPAQPKDAEVKKAEGAS